MRNGKVKGQSSRKLHKSRSDHVTQTAGKTHSKGCRSQHALTVSVVMVVISSVALHVHIALDKENWWQLHADEVYQSLEVAHVELYGYGFLAYEFAGVPPLNNTSLSILERSNAERGMYAMRSAITPKLFKIVIQLGSWISPKTSPYQIAKVCHCVWTGLLPGSVYLFALAFFSSTASAVLAASLVALSEPLLVLGTHTLVNSLVSPLLFAALAIAISIANHTLEIKDRALDAHNTNGHSGMEKTTRPDEESRSVESSSILTNHPSIYLLWWLSVPITGVVLGILCYVRVDLLLFVGILVVTTYSTRIPNMISRVGAVVTVITSFGLSFISGLILAGYTDRLFYGHWFITPIQWFRFNVHRDLATEIFGGHSWFLYIRTILIQDPVFLLLILVSVYGSIQLLRSSRDTTALKLLVCLVLLVIVYSTKGHKEVRFLHDWIVLTLVFCGHGIFVVSSHITNRSGQETWHRTALLLSLLAVFAASSYYRFPRAEDGSNKRWAYKRATDSGYVNLCLQWVGQQADATGVFVDHDVHGFGGYTVLQKRIPIIAKMNEEFREWDTATRKRSASLYAVNGFHNATSFDDFGLWVTVQNVQRLVKYLLMSSTYNYAVVSTDRQFLEVGFNEIKRFGSVRVLQRDNSEQMRQRLYKMGDGMAYGKDPDILETEGRTLYTSGFYSQALERLKAAIEMDPKRIQLRDLVRDAQLKIHSVNRNRRQFKQ